MIRTVSCTCQLFYAWRIYMLSERFWMSGIVAFVSFASIR